MNSIPSPWPRSPEYQEMISFESASIPVHVQMSPDPSGAAFAFRSARALQYAKLQISSHCTLWDFTSLTFSWWKAAHTLPASIRSLVTVLIDTSHTREIERMDDPSHSMARIWTRFSMGSLFISACIDCVIAFVKQ